MKSNTQFSVKLANGREENFETAAAMAAWVTLQRQLDRAPVRRARRHPAQRNARVNSQRPAVIANEPPLARYANRNSSEA